MNLFTRLQGTFFNPQDTFKALAQKPLWVDALILVLIAWMAFTYLVGPFQQQDQLQLMENNVKLRERLGEEQFNRMIERTKNPSQAQIIMGYVFAPVGLLIGFLVSSLFLMLMGRLGSTEGKFVQVLSAVIHANFIDKILGNAVRLFLILSRKSAFQATTSLAMFFPKLEVTSPLFLVLSQVDFFQLWMFGILGIGLSHIFKIDIKRALVISYVFWFFKSLFYVAITLLSMRFMGM